MKDTPVISPNKESVTCYIMIHLQSAPQTNHLFQKICHIRYIREHMRTQKYYTPTHH